MKTVGAKKTYYEILDISPSATEEEVQKAYVHAKEAFSPNSPALYSVFSPEEAEELMVLVEEAYAVLSDRFRRQSYDRDIGQTQLSSTPIKNVSHRSVSNSDPTMGRTRYSQYKINDEMEKEIASQDIFDGSFLQKIRDYKNISVEQVAEATRISKHYINAIEANDFNSLPANIFVRGFVTQFSKLLDIDHKKVADSYITLLKNSRGE